MTVLKIVSLVRIVKEGNYSRNIRKRVFPVFSKHVAMVNFFVGQDGDAFWFC